MARPQETPIFPATYDAVDDSDEAAAVTGCGCFRRFCFGRRDEENRSYLLREGEGGGPHREGWLAANLKKLREFSEVAAGPKWKNLIRKIGKVFNRGRRDKIAVEFQYSPESYALSFAGDDGEEDGVLMHSFSTSFAPGHFVNEKSSAIL